MTQFGASYLFAYAFWLGIALGSLAIVMLHALTGGKWIESIRAPLNAAIATLPVMTVLFLPMLLYRPHALLFAIRAVVYFAIWIALAFAMRRGRTSFAGPGLVLYVVTMTFAAWDWMMSIDHGWWSTIYGMTIVTGQGLAALCVALLFRDDDDESSIALGNLLLAFVMFWAYLAFSEFLIMWSANVKDEIKWYVPRMKTSWGWLAAALLVFAFFGPFLVLLFRSAKQNARLVAAVAIVILAMRYVHLLWTIAPALHPNGFYLHWLDIVLPITIGAIWIWKFWTAGYFDPSRSTSRLVSGSGRGLR